MSDPVLVVARAQVRPEAIAQFAAAARDCIEATRKEQGCLAYDLFESVSEPGFFVSVEHWETRADIDRHMAALHTVTFLTVAGACVGVPPVIEVIEPRSVDRL
jgi:quinol monooxygenase YgiN